MLALESQAVNLERNVFARECYSSFHQKVNEWPLILSAALCDGVWMLQNVHCLVIKNHIANKAFLCQSVMACLFWLGMLSVSMEQTAREQCVYCEKTVRDLNCSLTHSHRNTWRCPDVISNRYSTMYILLQVNWTKIMSGRIQDQMREQRRLVLFEDWTIAFQVKIIIDLLCTSIDMCDGQVSLVITPRMNHKRIGVAFIPQRIEWQRVLEI